MRLRRKQPTLTGLVAQNLRFSLVPVEGGAAIRVRTSASDALSWKRIWSPADTEAAHDIKGRIPDLCGFLR
jgi:hypothetical protein